MTARPVRTAADELVDVTFTVNGTPVSLAVPARLTLADALRDRLGLTGTHLGCEHGVCGMCTVVVDGAAARACLLFACQLDGAEVLTVEGLGTPDRQHPLQEAFSRHHALQCGFCTPGFLMSAYDLLCHRPDVPADELPTELSGVLCRCTGYRNIVAAVGEVAATHPEGVPGPLNCAVRTLAGRSGGTPAASGSPAPGPAATAASPVASVSVPTGTPTAAIEVTRELAAPLDAVWQVLADVHRLTPCLPGAELTEELGDDHYAGRAHVALGPVRLSFSGVAHIVERDAERHRVRVLASGSDAGGSTSARITLTAEPTATGSVLHATAEVHLSGRIAQFGRALAGDVSRRMFEQFAAAVEQAATTGAPPAAARTPGALSLLVAALRARLRSQRRK